jgi:hypothetical protein
MEQAVKNELLILNTTVAQGVGQQLPTEWQL